MAFIQDGFKPKFKKVTIKPGNDVDVALEIIDPTTNLPSITMTGAGAQTILGAQTFSGAVTFSENVTVSTGDTLAVTDADKLTVGGNIVSNTLMVSTAVQGTAAATATNYGRFFIADRGYTVTKISEVHRTAGSDVGAVTLSVERCQGTEAEGSGDDLLGATKVDLKGTADTVQSPALTATGANLVLAVGDRLVLKDTGTLTAVADVCVTVALKAS